MTNMVGSNINAYGLMLADGSNKKQRSPEYSSVDIAAKTGDIIGGLANELIAPIVSKNVGSILNPELNPWFGTPMGKVVPAKVAGTLTQSTSSLVSGATTSLLQSALHGKVSGVEESSGLMSGKIPANALVQRLVKGILTTWGDKALHGELIPPTAEKTKSTASDEAPSDTSNKDVIPNPTKDAFNQPLAPILGSIERGFARGLVGQAYDYTLGVPAQKLVNFITGDWDAKVKKPAPRSSGSIVNGLVQDLTTPFLVPSIAFDSRIDPKIGASLGGSLGLSVLNSVIGAAFETMYSRGIGTAIENGVNNLTGERDPKEQQSDPLPALEHFLRAATRGVAVGGTTFALGSMLNNVISSAGMQMGGIGGALLAVGGAALLGAVGGQLIDATIGPFLGKLGGQIYTLVTGKPNYEKRVANSPGPTPGSPVEAPNGNPGTVPSPDIKKAPALPPLPPPPPALGLPKKRKKLGQPLVDATSPAINATLTQLQASALTALTK